SPGPRERPESRGKAPSPGPASSTSAFKPSVGRNDERRRWNRGRLSDSGKEQPAEQQDNRRADQQPPCKSEEKLIEVVSLPILPAVEAIAGPAPGQERAQDRPGKKPVPLTIGHAPGMDVVPERQKAFESQGQEAQDGRSQEPPRNLVRHA